MLCKLLKILLFIIPYFVASTMAAKWLHENHGFYNPLAWLSEYVPCSLETIVFPKYYDAVLPLPDNVDVSGFILPLDGAILFQQDSITELGGELKTDRSCENGRSRRAELQKPHTMSWYDPKSWITHASASSADNQAVWKPHMERVPCSNDSVIISGMGPISIDMQGERYMQLGQLSLAGSFISKDLLQQLLVTDIGQMMFKNAESIVVQYFRSDTCGCLNVDEFIEPICHNVMGHCEIPRCIQPIIPYENCCPICGGVLRLASDTCAPYKLNKFRQYIVGAIEKEGITSDVNLHMSLMKTSTGAKYLQAILIDRGDYSETSARFIKNLNESTDWKRFLGNNTRGLHVQSSGRPYNPNVTFTSILLIFLCIIFVGFVALVMFAQYAPNSHYLRHIPQWLHDPRQWRALLLRRSQIVFARFDNLPSSLGGGGGLRRGAGTTATGNESDNVHESIIMGFDAESGVAELRGGRRRRGERAFDNPMFVESSGGVAAGASSVQTGENDDDDVGDAGMSMKSQPVKSSDKKEGTELRLVNITSPPPMKPARTTTTTLEDEQELKEMTLTAVPSSSDDDSSSSDDENNVADNAFLNLDEHERLEAK